MTITLGHILLLLALIAAFVAVTNTAEALRQGKQERGTPQYAQARMARRTTFYGLGLALLFGLLCLSPLFFLIFAALAFGLVPIEAIEPIPFN